MSVRLRILLLAIVQTLALVGMVGAKQWTLSTGHPVVLDVRPVDPRSLFSGDYVILNYQISRLSRAGLDGDKEFRRNSPIYLRLTKRDDVWQPLSAHRDVPDLGAGEIVLRGTVAWANNSEIRAKYGIEAFYLPEGEGREVERLIRSSRVQAEVVVDSGGRGVLRALIIDGQYRYADTLF